MDNRRNERLSIAIVGAGISGLTAAYLLHGMHDITLFEAEQQPGGHSSTTRIKRHGRPFDVDTGFVVYNEITYPNFVKLLDRLGVESEPTSMSFGVRCDRTGLEYCGTSLNTLFAQRRNLLRPSFLRMLRDILRFNREASELLEREAVVRTLGQFLEQRRFGSELVQHYVLPMAAAIWSASPARILDFPVHFFVRFFSNHGLLGTKSHLQWRVIKGGSRRYVEPLTEAFRDRIRTSTPVRSVRRFPDGVEVTPEGRAPERYDHLILATHSDQALDLLKDPTESERRILAALPYQDNDAALHIDESLLPRNHRARASWNYRIPADPWGRANVTYDMTRLQNLKTDEHICVSLNESGDIDPYKVIRRMEHAHPLFTPESLEAQAAHGEISGVGRTHYCGAYWRNGFHEDGVFSALRVCRYFGCGLE
jgi:predicted NAD/FAD-binding protein